LWNVSNVNDMSAMFQSTITFNQPLNNWNVSNVTDMSAMFHSARRFNQSLNNWDLTNVTDISDMFNNAQNFNQSLDKWNVSNVTNMHKIFYKAEAFNQSLNTWNVNKFVNKQEIFKEKKQPNWTIVDMPQGKRPFVTLWSVSKREQGSTQIELNTEGEYVYTLEHTENPNLNKTGTVGKSTGRSWLRIDVYSSGIYRLSI